MHLKNTEKNKFIICIKLQSSQKTSLLAKDKQCLNIKAKSLTARIVIFRAAIAWKKSRRKEKI
jgi:hypothetical protein